MRNHAPMCRIGNWRRGVPTEMAAAPGRRAPGLPQRHYYHLISYHLPECKSWKPHDCSGTRTVSDTQRNVRGQSLRDVASKSTTSSAVQRAMIAHRIVRVSNALTASLRLRRDLLVASPVASRMALLMLNSFGLPLEAARVLHRNLVSRTKGGMSTNLANRKPEEAAEGDSQNRHEVESDKSSGNWGRDSAAQDGGDQEKQQTGPSTYVCHSSMKTT